MFEKHPCAVENTMRETYSDKDHPQDAYGFELADQALPKDIGMHWCFSDTRPENYTMTFYQSPNDPTFYMISYYDETGDLLYAEDYTIKDTTLVYQLPIE